MLNKLNKLINIGYTIYFTLQFLLTYYLMVEHDWKWYSVIGLTLVISIISGMVAFIQFVKDKDNIN